MESEPLHSILSLFTSTQPIHPSQWRHQVKISLKITFEKSKFECNRLIFYQDSSSNPEFSTERFFYLGWVVNNLYNASGNGTWLWTQTDGITIPLNLSSPPPGNPIWIDSLLLISLFNIIIIWDSSRKSEISKDMLLNLIRFFKFLADSKGF